MSQDAEKDVNASPTSSPPDAKRRKLMERDAKGYHSFDRNNEIVLKFLKYYTVRSVLFGAVQLAESAPKAHILL